MIPFYILLRRAQLVCNEKWSTDANLKERIVS